MPSKHSKNSGDRAHYSHKEKKAAKVGSQSQRLGTDSQLPFGYCPLNLNPIEDAVVTPSGRLYSREAILEYILNKMREIKEQEAAVSETLFHFNSENYHYINCLFRGQIAKEQQEREREEVIQEANAKILLLKSFQESQVGVDDVVVGHKKRLQVEAEDTHNSYAQSRQRLIDDTDEETKLASLQMVSPWVPQFTPSAPAARPKAPPKRPPSPFSGQPLRTKDLIPVNLMKEISGDKSGPQRFVCPVSR